MRGFAAIGNPGRPSPKKRPSPSCLAQGTLSWAAPDRLEKHTTSPIEEVLVARRPPGLCAAPIVASGGNSASTKHGGMRVLVEAIRGTLAGDLAALRAVQRRFEAAQGDRPWRECADAALAPRARRGAAHHRQRPGGAGGRSTRRAAAA